MDNNILASRKVVDKVGRVHLPCEYRKAIGLDDEADSHQKSVVRIELNTDTKELRIMKAQSKD